MTGLLSAGRSRRRRAAATIAARLTLERVTRTYGATVALDAVDLDVSPGEVLSLLGHSGCGKTTLLRIAAGVEAPSEGRVLTDGLEVASPRIFVPPERRNIGLVFQDHALFPHMTILENVMFGLTALDPAARRAEAHASLLRVGLDHLADSYPHEASGGEQQRVALARAVAPRPGILLMDEPFSGLDSRLRDSVRGETLAVLRETGATAIIVTHDPEEAMRMSDRIVLMQAGRIVQLGTAEDLYRRPETLFAARFFSPLNEIESRVRDGRIATPLGEVPAPGLDDGQAAIVAIRPQDVTLVAAVDPGEGVSGRIVSRRFLGEVDHFDVALEGFDAYLMARGRTGRGLNPGDEVRVSFDPQDVLVFPGPDLRVG